MHKDHKHNNSGMEIGIYTLGDLGTNTLTGQKKSAHERLEEIIQAAKLADELGLDIFGVGEHHRLDYVSSATSVILSALARETKQIKLASTTTILSTVDPVRLYEDYATIDLLSSGRAEIIAGRGAFMESFDLFGYDASKYAEIFNESLDLLINLNEAERVTWEGVYRAPLNHMEIAPRPFRKKLPISIGIGGSIESAIKAGEAGIGMTLAILGGSAEKFIPLANTYRDTWQKTGHRSDKPRLGITGHGYIGVTSDAARDEFYPYYLQYKQSVKQRENKNYHLTRSEFAQLTNQDSALLVGSPEEVAQKILKQYEMFEHNRCLIQLDIGNMPFEQVARSIRLLAEEVVPMVNAHILSK